MDEALRLLQRAGDPGALLVAQARAGDELAAAEFAADGGVELCAAWLAGRDKSWLDHAEQCEPGNARCLRYWREALLWCMDGDPAASGVLDLVPPVRSVGAISIRRGGGGAWRAVAVMDQELSLGTESGVGVGNRLSVTLCRAPSLPGLCRALRSWLCAAG